MNNKVNPKLPTEDNRFLDFLESNRITNTCQELETTTYSALAASTALGCKLSQIVKSLIFTGIDTGHPVLVLVSGANKADNQRLSEIIGEKVRLADRQTVLTVSGFPAGAVPPAGFINPLFCIIDKDLSEHKNVWVSAGNDHALVNLSFIDLCQITGGKVTTINKSLAEPVIIEPYNPEWAIRFISEKKRIESTAGKYLIAIEHIGSTAVPGLAAKPIIDILGGINKLTESSFFIPLLENIGYCYIPEYEVQLPERRYLTLSDAGRVVIHLHIAELSAQFWQTQLAFRDLLRSDPDIRIAYGDLKIMLSKKYKTDRVGYTNAKSEFIRKVLHQDEISF